MYGYHKRHGSGTIRVVRISASLVILVVFTRYYSKVLSNRPLKFLAWIISDYVERIYHMMSWKIVCRPLLE